MQNQFIEKPASAKSIKLRKLVHGIGVNDVSYMTTISTKTIFGRKTSRCPFYQKWKAMLERCYSSMCHALRPTYKECTVCDDWLTFSNFRSWMIKQKWEGMQLDKDIISPGNKIYSPESCVFITRDLNTLLNDCAAKRGLYPQGVYLHNKSGKYLAHVSINGKQQHIGLYATPKSASNAYIREKTKLILQEASLHKDQAVANGLRLHADLLINMAG